MSASSKNSPAKKLENKQSVPEIKEIIKLIRTIDKVHERTDIKLKEIVDFCRDKKCNE